MHTRLIANCMLCLTFFFFFFATQRLFKFVLLVEWTRVCRIWDTNRAHWYGCDSTEMMWQKSNAPCSLREKLPLPRNKKFAAIYCPVKLVHWKKIWSRRFCPVLYCLHLFGGIHCCCSWYRSDCSSRRCMVIVGLKSGFEPASSANFYYMRVQPKMQLTWFPKAP